MDEIINYCIVCGNKNTNHFVKLTTYKCVNCWEVETRLREYLKSDNGKKFVKDMLKDCE